MSGIAVPADRGRKESPLRTEQFLPRRFSSRERSPNLIMDRVTRYRSPSKEREGVIDVSEELSPRIPQPYRTSFSAVTSMRSSTRKTSPLAGQIKYDVGTFPRGGVRSTLPDKIKYSRTKPNSPSQRSGSHDLLSSAGKMNQSEDELHNHVTPERAASCDLLDSPAHPVTAVSDQTVRSARSNPFDNRRLNPKYSSTPSRYHSKAPVVKSIESNKQKYSRLDSNISSNTIDSVFMPDSPQPRNSEEEALPSAISSDEPSGEISKPPDSGFVEGKVERRWLVEREYGTAVVLTYADLKKLKKKGGLPQPNEETAQLVEEMKEKARQRRAKAQSAPCTPVPEHEGRVGRSRWRATLNKKAHSITNFLRRLQSPRSNQKPDKRGRRSKSAGRLEGNRVFASGSNSSLGGVCEISYEVPSTSSDQSSSAFHTSTPSEPTKSSDTDLNQPETLGTRVQVLVTNSPSESAKHDSAKQNIASTSTRRMLKSLEDNLGGDNSVYRTFKEKQSPGYRRQAEALSMRPQALKAVEIPLQNSSKQSGSESTLEGAPGAGGCSAFDSSPFPRITTNDTIGDCSLDFDKTDRLSNACSSARHPE